jgi:aflatoxin B1 aldehyde reductase
MAQPKTAVDIVFGAMTIGAEGMLQSRVYKLEDAGALLDLFQKHGHNRVDTARVYGQGTSEEMLGKLNWQPRGIVMDTKLYPTVGMGLPVEISHGRKDLRENLLESLKALKTDQIDMWYLHGPDRTTPYEVTLEAVNELYKEGYFKRFGISNYMAVSRS